MNCDKIFIKHIAFLRNLIFFRKEEILNEEITNECFNDWVNQWYIINILDDIFSLPKDHIELTDISAMFFWLKYDNNSYISGETALEYYWLYLSTISWITFMSNKKYNIEIEKKSLFFYTTVIKNIKENIETKKINLSNSKIGINSKTNIRISNLELALIDYLSIRKYEMDEEDFRDSGLYLEEISKIIDKEKLLILANETNTDYIIKSVNNLLIIL